MLMNLGNEALKYSNKLNLNEMTELQQDVQNHVGGQGSRDQ